MAAGVIGLTLGNKTFLLFSKSTLRKKLFISWVGLKGAKPIIFAFIARAAGRRSGRRQKAIVPGGKEVLAEPFRRDALNMPVRYLDKYAHLNAK